MFPDAQHAHTCYSAGAQASTETVAVQTFNYAHVTQTQSTTHVHPTQFYTNA